MKLPKLPWPGLLLALALGACAAGAVFPPDVQRAFRDEAMLRAETEHLVLYYPARRKALAERFALRADACAAVLKRRAQHHGRTWAEKMTITMPEVAFNNAYVSPKIAGSPDHAVVPTFSTLDFATELGLPPDPGFIACHELVHYVHSQQIGGLWAALDLVMGPLFTPQLGFDPWLFEGLATYYESALQPGAGRPSWPLFTGMFAAAYADRPVQSGELSELGRQAPVGHHYLVGTMFVQFLVERYGEAALWRAIAKQATAWTGLVSAWNLRQATGKSLGALVDELDAWKRARFPVRARPPQQRRLATVGNDARYARSREGSEAWIADELDAPTALVVRDRDGRQRARVELAEALPPRRMIIASPQLVSGLSLTADGKEVWLTAIDLGAEHQVTRLLRWRQGEGLREVARDLGPGGTIDATGAHYYYLAVDGDRWSLAVYDVATGARRTLLDAAPGTYVLSAQLSPDGATLAASAWNGAAFTIWLLDPRTGALRRELREAGPLYDPAFLDDGRLIALATVDGRFQLQVRTATGDAPRVISDLPYAALAPRGAGAAVRFLNREGWSWTLDEVPLPAAEVPDAAPAGAQPGVEPGAAPAPQSETTPVAAAPGTSSTIGTAPATAVGPGPSSGAAPSAGAPPSAAPTTVDARTTAPPLTAVGAAPSTAPAPGLAPGATTPPTPLLSTTPTPAPPSPPTTTLRGERPYSAWDGLLVPSLRVPTLITVADGVTHLGLVLGGADVLGTHSWLVSGTWQPKQEGDAGGPYLGGAARYRTTVLAPWTLVAEGSTYHGAEKVAPDDEGAPVAFRDRKTRDASILAARSWAGTWALAAGAVYSRARHSAVAPGELAEDRELGGPAVAASYFGGDSTPYTGLRRGVGLDVAALHFPVDWSSLPRAATSLRAELLLAHPVPGTRRHLLRLTTIGHAIVRQADLIELGGSGAFTPLSFSSSRPEPDEIDVATPANLRLIEPLRGYEDTSFAVAREVQGELTWTYPIIFDRGVAATAWIFPPSFLRQLDLELFAAGALAQSTAEPQTASHLALGGALTLRVALLRAPLALRVQLARRVRDDRATTSMLAIGADL